MYVLNWNVICSSKLEEQMTRRSSSLVLRKLFASRRDLDDVRPQTDFSLHLLAR